MADRSRRTLSKLGARVLVFLTAAAVLVLEILAGRLLAPFIGVSIETFTGNKGIFDKRGSIAIEITPRQLGAAQIQLTYGTGGGRVQVIVKYSIAAIR